MDSCVLPAARRAAAAAPPAAPRLGAQPLASPLDKRAYRTLTLANGLRVFLASDPRSDMAAAALDVGVGSYSDPLDLPGLAHFLEHMLFMGTAEFPDENDFADFLSKHGGSSNAYTACEHTNYYFEVAMSPAAAAAARAADSAASESSNGDSSSSLGSVSDEGEPPTTPASAEKKVERDPLAEALARFSQFFIAPLFTESATDRELTAVDHEHAKNLLNDGWRLGQVQAACGNPLHPRARFSTGSRETLCDIPKKKGIDVRAALLAFHHKYYSANLMHLCITGPQDLNRLQELAVKLFSDIENKCAPLPSLEYAAIEPVTETGLGRVIYAQTVNVTREVELTWVLPPVRPGFRDSSPASASGNCARDLDAAVDLVSDLLGYEGAGSLTSYLKAQGWIEDLCTGSGGSYEHYSTFICTIDLTLAGVEKVDDVVKAVYAYLRLIRDHGVCEWVHDEIVTLCRNSFRFASRIDPVDLACHVSASMAFRRDTELLCGRSLEARYDAGYVHRVLDLLTPARMTLALSGEFVKKHTNTREPIYGAEYGFEVISEDRMDAWRTATADSSMAIRRPNPFIATNFSIVADHPPEDAVTSKEPQRLLDSEKFELYFAPDLTYRQPHAEVSVSFITSDPLYSSAASSLCASIALSLFEDNLNELSYDAGAASLNYSVSSSTRGIFVSVNGYNEKLDTFFIHILERLASFRATTDRYPIIKDEYEMGLRNTAQREPISHATSQTHEYCEEPSWSSAQCLAALESESVSLGHVNEFLDSLIPVARAIVFVNGNVSAQWALQIPKTIEMCLDFEAPAAQEVTKMHVPRVVRLPEGVETMVRKEVPNEDEENSAIEVLFQVGEHSVEWVHTDASLELLVDIMRTPFFDELRTKQQLGYLVSADLDCWRNVYGLSVSIQGKRASPMELRLRINAFMNSFRDSLCKMSDKEFEKYVNAAVTVRAEPDLTFNDCMSRMDCEIFVSREFLWDRQDCEVQALKSATKDTVVALFDDFIREGSPRRRVFTSCAYGMNHKISDDGAAIMALGDGIQEVRDSALFKLNCDLHRSQGSQMPN